MSRQYRVENMKCDGCVAAVKTALEQLDGIESVSVDLQSKIAEITGEVASTLVEKTLADIGYPASQVD